MQSLIRAIEPVPAALAHGAIDDPERMDDHLEAIAAHGFGDRGLDAALLPVESALELPQVQATDAGAARIMNGNPGQVIGHAEFGTEVWVSHEGRAIGIGRYMGGEVHPSRVFVRP